MKYPPIMNITAAGRIITSTVSLLLISIALASAQTTEANIGFWKYRAGIVHIGLLGISKPGETPTIERWLGTGFAVDGYCTFATAKHVLASGDRQRIAVRFQLPQDESQVRTVAARVLFESPANDLAFVKIDVVNNGPCQSGRLYTFDLRPAVGVSTLTGKDVFIIGHPVLAQGKAIDIPIIRRGIIASSEIHWESGRMLLLDLIGVPGFSGSPVILQDTGEAVGIVYGPGPTPRGLGFEWATPITREDYERAVTAKPSDSRTR